MRKECPFDAASQPRRRRAKLTAVFSAMGPSPPARPKRASRRCRSISSLTRAEFDALEDEWNALFARAGQGTQLFQTFNWLWHWCNHFVDGCPGTRLSVVTARRHGRLVLVWPLVSERAGLLTRLSWMGEPVSQYGDVVMEDEAGGLDLLREAWIFLLAADTGERRAA